MGRTRESILTEIILFYVYYSLAKSTQHFFRCLFNLFSSYLLARYPEIQKKCKDEIREVLKGESDITPEKLGQLKYLTCVLKESLRMYSIIPSIMRRTTKDVEVTKDDGSKLRIPAQTNVMLPFAAISRVDKYWEDPNEFKPGKVICLHSNFPSPNNLLIKFTNLMCFV